MNERPEDSAETDEDREEREAQSEDPYSPGRGFDDPEQLDDEEDED